MEELETTRGQRIALPIAGERKASDLTHLVIIKNEGALSIDLWMTLQTVQNSRGEFFSN
jgi:hypothetical protein